MLYPQQNAIRNVLDLSGVWEFQLDPDDVGQAGEWYAGLPAPRRIAVPASWNEQFQDTHDYLELAWYRRTFFVPRGWAGERIFLRFDSVNYAATVWVNGHLVGAHEGGHLPFGFEVTDYLIQGEENALAVAVEARLMPTRVPPGNVVGGIGGFMRNYPATSYDFFPYAGIQRPVYLLSLPQDHIVDVTVTTALDGDAGTVTVDVQRSGPGTTSRIRLEDADRGVDARVDFTDGRGQTVIQVPQAQPWSPADPHLYRLTILLEADDGTVVDHYALKVGIRTVAVRGDRLFLNGEPIFLTGFGRHEDFPIHGRGLDLPVMIKDHALLKWVGANSYRTSHYPYAEEQLQLADELGLLVIAETPAVGLHFEDDDAAIQTRLDLNRRQLQDLIRRDKNHACVIAWSVANEPIPPDMMARMQGGTPSPVPPTTTAFFTTLIDDAHAQDPTRPATLAAIMGCPVEWMDATDFIMINRYWGWYSQSAQLDLAERALEQELDALYNALGKPILISEFGADTLPGVHSDPPTLWSEEYQVEFLRRYLDVAARKSFVAGLHVWAFADFKTAQGIMRAGTLNHKGVFTRLRQPKQAAHFLRARWQGEG